MTETNAISKTISKNIKQRAKQLGMKLSEVAEKSGCTPAYLYQIKSVKSNWIPIIARVLQCSPDELTSTSILHNPTAITVLANIKKLAKQHKWGLAQLAARVGCEEDDLKTITNAENKWLPKIANELQREPADLLAKPESEAKTAKPIIPGALSRRAVKGIVDNIGEEVNRYYKPGSSWMPNWVDKPEMEAPDMVRAIIKQISREIKRLSPMAVNDVDMSLDEAQGFKMAVQGMSEKAAEQLRFYKHQAEQSNNVKVDDSGLQAEVADLKKKLAERKTKCAELDDMNQGLQNNLDVAIGHMGSIDKRNEELQETVDNLKLEAKMDETHKHDVKPKLDDTNAGELEDKIKQLTKMNAKYELQNDRLKDTLIYIGFEPNNSEQCTVSYSRLDVDRYINAYKDIVDDDQYGAVKAGYQLALNTIRDRCNALSLLHPFKVYEGDEE